MDGLKMKQRVSDETVRVDCLDSMPDLDGWPVQYARDLRDARAERDTAVARVAELEALLGQARDEVTFCEDEGCPHYGTHHICFSSKDCTAQNENMVTNALVLRALLICGAHCQGGHSEAGRAISHALGIPFPVTMNGLQDAARIRGLKPSELWPWLFKTAVLRAPYTKETGK